MWFFYDADGNPSGFKYQNGSTVYNYYYVCNWRGDVVALYANDGLKYTYEYDAWGKMLAIRNVSGEDVTGAANIANYNPLRYRGYYYDSETGLYYINSRYYDPQVKRFVNSDDDLLSATSPQALIDKNYFTYCDNNPVGRADGEGDCWHIVIGATVGGMLSATTQVIEQGGIHSKKDIAKVAVSLVTGAISGGVGATGIGLFASSGIDAGLTMFTSFGIDLIDNDFTLVNVDWWGIVADTVDVGATSLLVGEFYGDATDKVLEKAKKSISKGENKIIKGITSPKTASKVKGSIKTGQKLIKLNRKRINRINSVGSVLGSIISAVRSIVNKFKNR